MQRLSSDHPVYQTPRKLLRAAPRSLDVQSPRRVLVLGGGGMKGMAHLGAWKALQEHGYTPDAIIGTSIGSLMGALIACRVDTETLIETALGVTKDDVVKLNRRVLWQGLKQTAVLLGEHYRSFIRRLLPVHRFRDLSIPLRLNAMSLISGQDVWFGTGAREDIRLVDAIYASCAIPMYFPPLHIREDVLVDGGMQTTLGVDAALAWGAQHVIAIDVRADLMAPAEGLFEKGMLTIHDRILGIVGAARRQREIERWRDAPFAYIRPDVGGMDTFEFGQTNLLIERGYDAIQNAIQDGSLKLD